MKRQTLLPDPECLHLLHVEADTETITIVVTTMAEETASQRVVIALLKCIRATVALLLIFRGWDVLCGCGSMSVAFSVAMLRASRKSLQSVYLWWWPPMPGTLYD